MPRPTTKTDLITVANAEFAKLWKMIDAMSEKQQNDNFAFDDRDKNLRDVLVHLYEWHQLLLNWIKSNRNGEQKPFLPEPYNWKTYPEMNVEFWKKHQNISSLSESKTMLNESHKNVIALIETFSDDELFTKKYFQWTGTTSLGSYCISASSSHYDWAMKKLKNHIKTSN